MDIKTETVDTRVSKRGKGVRQGLKNYLLGTTFTVWVMSSIDAQTPALCNLSINLILHVYHLVKQTKKMRLEKVMEM